MRALSWLLTGLLGVGCAGVGGDGRDTTRSVPIGPFDTLVATDGLLVRVEGQSDVAVVRGEGGIVDAVRIKQRGGTLELSVEDDDPLVPDLTLVVLVPTSSVARIQALGASVVRAAGLDRPLLALEARDGSALEVSGRVGVLSLVGATAADVDADAVDADDVEVRGYSAADMSVSARRAVRGVLTENASLLVRGDANIDGVEVLRDAEIRRQQ